MIEIATEEMTAGIRESWKKCFTLDDPRYFEHFFRYIYKPEYFFVDLEGRDVAATICRIPHSVMFNGRVIQMSMISHACTMPNYRNEGRMKKMIDAAVDYCVHNELITLVSATYGESYRPYGFEPIYYRASYKLNREDVRTTTYGCAYDPQPLDMLKAYSAYIKHFNGYYARDLEYFVNLKREITARGGKIVAYYDEKHIIRGYATILLEGKEAKVEELVYLDSQTIMRLLGAASQERAVINVHVTAAENLAKIFPKAEKKEFPVVMAKLNDPKLFSRLFGTEARTIQEAYGISRRPLYINEPV